MLDTTRYRCSIFVFTRKILTSKQTVIKIYLDKIVNSSNVGINHLSAFSFDYDRFKWMLNKYNYKDRGTILSTDFKISQCLQLKDFLTMIENLENQIATEANIDKTRYLIIEDIDEAFNIAVFDDYIIASTLIIEIVKKLRKLSQIFKVTCIITQQIPKCNFHLKQVSKNFRNLMDNQLFIDGTDNYFIDSIYV